MLFFIFTPNWIIERIPMIEDEICALLISEPSHKRVSFIVLL